jgi:O-antigen/teichoic acid export membrane protein
MVVLDQGFLSIATFVTGILLARAITKEAYAAYVLGTSLILIFQGFHRALVSVPFTVYAPRLCDDERDSYQGSAFIHTLVLFACALVAAFLLAQFDGARSVRWIDVAAGALFFPLLALVTGFGMVRDFIRGSLLARLRVEAAIAVNVVATAAQLAIITLLFAAGRLTLRGALSAMAATSAFAGACLLWKHRNEMRVVTNRIGRDFVSALRTGKWVVVDVLGFMAASQAYPWLLLYFSDARQVAVFGVCNAFAGLIGPLARGAGAYIHPRMVHAFAKGDAIHLGRVLRVAVAAIAVPYVVWLVFGSLFAERLVVLIYGHAYSGYVVVTILLLIKATVEGVSSPFAQALQTMERADLVTLSLLASAFLTVGAGSIVISQMGLQGAAIAAVMSSLVNALFKWTAVRRMLRAPADNMRTWARF